MIIGQGGRECTPRLWTLQSSTRRRRRRCRRRPHGSDRPEHWGLWGAIQGGMLVMLTNNHFKVSVFLHNRSAAPRTVSINSNSDWKQFCYSYNTQVKVVLSSHSSFYTGQKAHLVKRGEGSFTLKSGEKETLSMEVSPESYMDKVTQITPFQDAFPTYSARWLTCAWWRTTFWWLWLRLDSHGVRRMISFSKNQ